MFKRIDVVYTIDIYNAVLAVLIQWQLEAISGTNRLHVFLSNIFINQTNSFAKFRHAKVHMHKYMRQFDGEKLSTLIQNQEMYKKQKTKKTNRN